MADEPNVPAQTEGAGQKAKTKPEPVNLAMIEAAKRGIVLDPPVPEKKAPATPLPPPPPPPSEEEPLPPPPPIDDEPEASAEPPSAPGSPETTEEAQGEAGSELEVLARLADASLRGRLSPHVEDRATRLMREFIKAGNPAPAFEAMAKLPWILGVRAAEQSWPALDEAARSTLLEGLGALAGDNAARLRLSLSRSLAKLDPPSGLRLAAMTCRGLWNAERGALTADQSKLIGNVFIGRGKPWVLQLPLAGLPPEDAAPIASCAVFSAFNVNNPPITQLSVLRYAAPLLGGLHENLLGLVARGVSRWSGKWQNALRREVQDLPPVIAAALKQDKPESAEPPAEPAAPEDEAEVPLPPELEEKLKIANESGDAEAVAAVTLEINSWREANRPAPPAEREEEEEGAEGPKRGRRQRGRERDRDRERQERQDKKERPAYVSRDQERQQDVTRSGGGFNLPAVLKQIEAHVAQLRNELGNAQAKLRKTDTAPRRTDRISLSVEEANLSPDELRRLILQLEARNTELQSRVDDLLGDSEERAQIMATAGVEDPTAQFCSLLALKLQDGYGDFIALERGAPDVIVRQHYRGLLREIFALLIDQGIPLVGTLPPPPPTPMPPPPPPPELEGEEEEDEDEEEVIEPAPEEPFDEDAEDEPPAGEDEAPPADEDAPPRDEEQPDEPPSEDAPPPEEPEPRR